jgi:hypothetical protein
MYVVFEIISRIGGIMVSVIVSSSVDRGLKPWSGQIKPKTTQLVFVATPLSTQH